MIVDCHTYVWENLQQLGIASAEFLRRQSGRTGLTAEPAEHLVAAECVDCSLVLGFRSELLGADVPNRTVADYVAKHPEKLLGLAGIDPIADDAADRLDEAAESSAFRGVTIAPGAQGFHPADTRVERLYQRCSDEGMVVLVNQGAHLWPGAMMEFARPYLWDEVLRNFPEVKMILSHLGHPWVDETIALLGKHANLYADVAGLIRRPWHAYNTLNQVHQYGVMEKVLFASDFPFLSASEAIESLYRLNEVTHGARLPVVPREGMRGVIERDVFEVLGIRPPVTE